MIEYRLQQARKAAGFSLRELADKTEVSHTAISKFEKGELTPNSTQLLKLAKALNIRVEYFFRPQKTELQAIEYRKRASFSKKDQDRVEGDILEQAERWQELHNLYLCPPIPTFSPPSLVYPKTEDDLESFAKQVREVWKWGFHALPDLINLLEFQGIIVIVTGVEAEKFDGLSAHVGKQALIVINSHWAGDRQRFTLAHELGHLLLHGHLPEDLDEEKACNHFAGALLLPKLALFEQTGEKTRHHIEARELYGLKHEFGLSMRACLHRFKQTGLINESVFKRWQIHFNVQKWCEKEPGDAYPQETTTLFEQLVYRGLAEGYYGEAKAAELLNMSLADFRQQRNFSAD